MYIEVDQLSEFGPVLGFTVLSGGKVVAYFFTLEEAEKFIESTRQETSHAHQICGAPRRFR